jgi:hypothetical protein
MLRKNGIKVLLAVFVTILLITWITPPAVLLADDSEEEEILKELSGEEETSGEGSVEVLGFTDEEVSLLGDKSLLTVIIIIVAAVGGLFLSFVVRSRT